MAVPFGFSVGDFVATIGLCKDIAVALKDTGGAATEYQNTLRELERYAAIFLEAQYVKEGGHSTSQVLAIRSLAGSASKSLEDGLKSITRFDGKLGAAAPQGARHGTVSKIRWTISMAKEVMKLRQSLDAEVQSLMLLIQLHNTATISRNRIDISNDLQQIKDRIDSYQTSSDNQRTGQSAEIRNEISNQMSFLTYDLQEKSSLILGQIGLIRNILQQPRQSIHGRPNGISFLSATSPFALTDSTFRDTSQSCWTPTMVDCSGEGLCSEDNLETQHKAILRSSNSRLQRCYLQDFGFLQLLIALLFRLLEKAWVLSPQLFMVFALVGKIPASISLRLSDNIVLIDVLGRKHSLQFYYFRDWPVIQAMLICHFEGRPGIGKVRDGQFGIIDYAVSRRAISPAEWKAKLRPGAKLVMCMNFSALKISRGVCPSCQKKLRKIKTLTWNCTHCEITFALERGNLISYEELIKIIKQPGSPTDSGQILQLPTEYLKVPLTSESESAREYEAIATLFRSTYIGRGRETSASTDGLEIRQDRALQAISELRPNRELQRPANEEIQASLPSGDENHSENRSQRSESSNVEVDVANENDSQTLNNVDLEEIRRSEVEEVRYFRRIHIQETTLLHDLVVDGNVQAVRETLPDIPDVDEQWGRLGTPLGAAIIMNDPKMVDVLLKYGANPLHVGGLFSSPIEAAAFLGRVNILSTLLRSGVATRSRITTSEEVEHRQKTVDRALLASAFQQDKNIVYLLLRANANPFRFQTETTKSALAMAVSAKNAELSQSFLVEAAWRKLLTPEELKFMIAACSWPAPFSHEAIFDNRLRDCCRNLRQGSPKTLHRWLDRRQEKIGHYHTAKRWIWDELCTHSGCQCATYQPVWSPAKSPTIRQPANLPQIVVSPCEDADGEYYFNDDPPDAETAAVRQEIKFHVVVKSSRTERERSPSRQSRAPNVEEGEDNAGSIYPDYLDPSQPFIRSIETVIARRRSESSYENRGQSKSDPYFRLPPSLSVSRESSPGPGSGRADKNRRSSTSSSPALDYILDLSDPSRPTASNSTASNRVQKHPALFQCHLCPKRFTRAYNLRFHLRTHTDEQPFVCTVCGKAFARQHDRKRHEGLHSGEKRFVCKGELRSGGQWGCGRRFARADALGRHFRSEAGRICIKPLLDEEVAEREENRMLELQQTQYQLGSLQPVQQQMTFGMDAAGVGGFALPAALLAQCPALNNIDWSTMSQGEDPGEDSGEMSDVGVGRSSFDASRGSEYYGEGDIDNGKSVAVE